VIDEPASTSSAAALRRRRRGVATGASVALHGLAAVLFLGRIGGDPAAGGDEVAGEGPPTFDVTLVSRARLAPQSAPEAEAGGLRPLFAKLGSDAPAVVAPDPHGGSALGQLFDRLSRQQPQMSPTKVPVPAAPPEAEANDDDMGQADRTAGAGAPNKMSGPGKAGGGGLWGQIEPCWRNLGLHPAAPVTLDIVLDPAGRLAAPPRIVRTAGQPVDEPRLRAEAGALAALAQCLPKSDARFGGQAYRLDFSARS
jgi:hypothetical protein